MTPAEIKRALDDTEAQLVAAQAEIGAAKAKVRLLKMQRFQLRAWLKQLHLAPEGSRLDSTMPEKTAPLSLKDRLQRLAADPKRSKAIKIAAANAMRAGVISEARVLLLEQNVTDSQVAEVCGVARPTVQAWHAKRNPIAEEHKQTCLSEWAIPFSAWN